MRRRLHEMAHQIGMAEIAKTHFLTLTRTYLDNNNVSRERGSKTDFSIFFILPVSVGALLFFFGVETKKLDQLLAGSAVLTGLLFALLVLMFERIVHTERALPPEAGVDPVTDAWRVLANVSWSILISIGLLTLIFAANLFVENAAPAWLTGIIAAVFLHLALTLLMILRRVFFMAMRIAGYRRLTEPQR